MNTKLIALGLLISFCGIATASEGQPAAADDYYCPEPSTIRTVVGKDSYITRKVVTTR